MLIPDDIRKSVVFLLYKNKDKILTLAGTGFFVALEIEKILFVNLITAKHVIVNISRYSIDGKVIIRINYKKGGYQNIEVNVDEWKEHPTESSSVDVSVLTCAPSIEMYDIRFLPTTMMATNEIVKRESIGPGDEIFITGLFVNHFGKTRNIPIVRVGNIALMPEEKVNTKIFGSIEAYLIEARSIGGLSGSPVFVNIEGIRKGQWVLGKQSLYLLGLIHGHWDIMEKAFDESKEDVSDVGNINMGIAIVVPATKILEVINQPMLMEKRQKFLEQNKKEKNLL